MKIRRKIAILLSVAVLSGAVFPESGVAVVSASAATKNEIDKTEREKNELEGELDQTNNNLGNLEDKRDALEKELGRLNAQLIQVAENLAALEQQIRDKEQEIADTQEALDEAKATEEWQYDSMVAIVRCMYEHQEDGYFASLLSSGSFAELLNRADYIERTVAYEQKMLKEYTENRILIEEHEARLQREREDLQVLREQAEAEKNKVSEIISRTSSSISKYADQISDAEARAREYEEQIRKKEENLEALKKKLAEEIAMSQAAANGTWRDISEVTFEENDRYLLANLIYCEAGAEPYDGKVAVGSVVINRVLSSKYPDTVVGVIYQNRQFSPVASGRLALALEVGKANDDCYRAADEAMSGITNVGNCVYFRTPIEGLTGINIGGHVFY